MKESIYKSIEKSLKNFDSKEEAIFYYRYMLEHNEVSSAYPQELREFHKGLIMGLEKC